MASTDETVSLKKGRVRTPTVLQMEAVECGAAALGTILGYFGRIVPLAQLRRDCGVSRDGSKASNLLAAAKGYGLKAKGFKKDIGGLKDLAYPFIVFWNFNHFLVVEGQKKGWVYLNDPASGPRKVTYAEFDEAYTGVVLVMEPGPEFKRGGRKPSMVLSLWDRVRGSLAGLAVCTLVALFLVLPGLAGPTLTQIFIDKVLIEGLDDWARPIIIGIILTALIKAILTRLQLRLLRQFQTKLSVVMSSRFLWHLLRLPVSYYSQRFSGEISNRLQLNNKVASVLSGRVTTTLIDVLMMIFYVAVMLQFDVLLTLIGLGFAGINFMSLQWIGRKRTDGNQRLSQEFGKLSAVAISGLQSIRTIKASALESDFFSRWSGHYAKAVNAQQELAATNVYMELLPTFSTTLMTMAILIVGGFRVIDGALTIGMLVAFQGLMTSFLGPVHNLLGLGGTLQELQGDVNRLDDVLTNPALDYSERQEAPPTDDPTVRLQGYVSLKNLTFGYNPMAPPLIEDFSLHLKPGQRIALVGGSGSGKSTVAKLIAGLYETTSGEILFDDMPRPSIPRNILTNSLAVVEQDIVMFGGTVRDNLTLWDETIPEEQLVQACKDALIHVVIVALPDGYSTKLLEGAADLSGGQRQRLEIARALVNSPSILVLDEATSALDAESEKVIDQNIRRRGCTCIIVAHRLSTIRDADEIIVMDHGKIVQRGTHETLYFEGGRYADLLFSDGAAT